MTTLQLLQGDAFELLTDVETGAVDLVLTDPPFSERTHKAQGKGREPLPFEHLTPAQVYDLAYEFDRVSRRWIVVFCDHVLMLHWLEAFEGMKHRYTFAPVVSMTPGRSVRLNGDGPASWSDYMIITRPRTRAASKWRALPGGYINLGKRAKKKGGKSLLLGSRLVRHYSNRGETVLDPFMGRGTFGAASMMTGRSFVGFELDPKEMAKARAEVTLSNTPENPPTLKQSEIFKDDENSSKKTNRRNRTGGQAPPRKSKHDTTGSCGESGSKQDHG